MTDAMTLSAPIQQIDTSSHQQSESVSPNASLYETSSNEATQLSAANTSGISVNRALDLLIDHSEGLSQASNSSGASLNRSGSSCHANDNANHFGLMLKPKSGEIGSDLFDPTYNILNTICAASWPQAPVSNNATSSFQQSVSVPCGQQGAGTNASQFNFNDSGIDVSNLSLHMGLLNLTQSTESGLFTGNPQPQQKSSPRREQLPLQSGASGWPITAGANELLASASAWNAGAQTQPNGSLLTASMSRQISGVGSMNAPFGGISPVQNNPNNDFLKSKPSGHQAAAPFADGVGYGQLEAHILELVKAQHGGVGAPNAPFGNSNSYAVGGGAPPVLGRSVSHSAATGYNHNHSSQSAGFNAGAFNNSASNGGSASSLIDPNLLVLLGRQTSRGDDGGVNAVPHGRSHGHGRHNGAGFDRHAAHDRFGGSHSHGHGFGSSAGVNGGFDRSGGGPVTSLLNSYQHAVAQNSSGSHAANNAHSHGETRGNGNGNERFSRKVFVGGLPPDVDEDEIAAAFMRFGALVVDWPHKAESKSYFPPKGYCFLLFQEEASVHALLESCVLDCGKYYWVVSSPTVRDKPVQIRPWELPDSDCVMDPSHPLDPRKTIFVGGVPRPLKASELAVIMDRYYGNVCYAGIDTDPELKYPKGAGRVAFSSQQSYIAAISARFVQLQIQDIDKRVEVKPYVLDDQMCDECGGTRCGGKYAPFFCGNVTCLQYYCESCWATIHSRPGREYHKPLVKEGADRPRAIMPPFTQRW